MKYKFTLWNPNILFDSSKSFPCTIAIYVHETLSNGQQIKTYSISNFKNDPCIREINNSTCSLYSIKMKMLCKPYNGKQTTSIPENPQSHSDVDFKYYLWKKIHE